MDNLLIELEDKTVMIRFSGEITLDNSDEYKAEIEKSLARDFKTLILDLSGIKFMDSSGIGFLVSLNSRIKGMGKKMFLYKPAEQVKNTLDLVQLLNFFQILEHEDDLLTI